MIRPTMCVSDRRRCRPCIAFKRSPSAGSIATAVHGRLSTVVLINGEFDWSLRLFDIEPDELLEDRIAFKSGRVSEQLYLDPGIMPAFEPQRDSDLVKALFPKDNGAEIDLSGDNRALALVDDLIGSTGGADAATRK